MRGFALPLFSHIFLKREQPAPIVLCFWRIFRKKNSIVYPVFLPLFCTTSQSSKSTQMGVSDPSFKVPEKIKQGSEPLFMTTAV